MPQQELQCHSGPHHDLQPLGTMPSRVFIHRLWLGLFQTLQLDHIALQLLHPQRASSLQQQHNTSASVNGTPDCCSTVFH